MLVIDNLYIGESYVKHVETGDILLFTPSVFYLYTLDPNFIFEYVNVS